MKIEIPNEDETRKLIEYRLHVLLVKSSNRKNKEYKERRQKRTEKRDNQV